MRFDLYARWSLETRRADLFAPGERVGVAVSGGPDSVLLLNFMERFAGEAGLCISVVHFNHRLRGAESNEDERFVAELARQSSLEFHRATADVARVARERKRNIEAAARDLRYQFFFSLIRQGRVNKIATAHTANDQAETVLLRLLRGAGTRGLGGIFPVLEDKVVRPFLGVTRAEIENEIERRRLSIRVDRSNLDRRFARNRIRQDLLPLLQEQFNPEIVRLLKQFADRARDDESYLEQQAAEAARPWRIREGNTEKIPVRPFAEFPRALQRRVLRQMIVSASGGLSGVTAAHIESLRRFLIAGHSGKQLALPAGLEAHRAFEWLVIRPRHAVPEAQEYCYLLSPPTELSASGVLLKFRYETVENLQDIGLRTTYNIQRGAYIDAEKLSGELILRNWRPGDRLGSADAGKPRKLKELFIQREIPVESRRVWPVLVSGGEMVWARGFLPASRFAVSSVTERILVIEEEPEFWARDVVRFKASN